MKLSDHIERLEKFRPNLQIFNTMGKELTKLQKRILIAREIKVTEDYLDKLKDISRRLVSGENVEFRVEQRPDEVILKEEK